MFDSRDEKTMASYEQLSSDENHGLFPSTPDVRHPTLERFLREPLLHFIVLGAALFAQDKAPSGTIELETTSIDIGIGASWSDGTLTLANGEKHRFSVKGLNVDSVGLSKLNASGKVYDLNNLADFSGNYVVADAGPTLGGGMSGIAMRNQNGVVMALTAVQQGVRLSLAVEGIDVQLKN